MKDVISGLDPKTARTASIVVAVAVALSGIVAFISRDTLLPLVLDQVFHVSRNIERSIQKDVASGYARTFVFDDFHDDAIRTKVPQTLLFHYTDRQEATLVLQGSAYDYTGKKPIRVRVLVDDVVIAPQSPLHRELPIKGTLSKLPKSVFDESIVTQDVHVLKIEPETHDDKALIVVEALVLVTNPPPST
jgi:hypothetical protein